MKLKLTSTLSQEAFESFSSFVPVSHLFNFFSLGFFSKKKKNKNKMLNHSGFWYIFSFCLLDLFGAE